VLSVQLGAGRSPPTPTSPRRWGQSCGPPGSHCHRSRRQAKLVVRTIGSCKAEPELPVNPAGWLRPPTA
jgi:hypothetical protein